MRNIWKPEICHGIGKSRFEGWYYKFADATNKTIYAIIPGYSSVDPAHAFIQVFNGTTGEYKYNKFNIKNFQFSKKKFEVMILGNHFSKEKIKLDLDNQERHLEGELFFTNHVSWPVKLLSPGAMGPLAFLPRIECSYSVLSFDHEVYGSLSTNGEAISFDGGRGYIDKNWGRNFPKAWVWMQSNHFKKSGISFVASIAKMPYLGRNFSGFLAGFLLQDKLYLFSKYNRSKLKNLSINKNIVSFKITRKNISMEVEAIQSKPVMMKGPGKGGMTGKVFESLTSKINVHFVDIHKKIDFTDTGKLSGLEIMATEKNLF